MTIEPKPDPFAELRACNPVPPAARQPILSAIAGPITLLFVGGALCFVALVFFMAVKLVDLVTGRKVPRRAHKQPPASDMMQYD